MGDKAYDAICGMGFPRCIVVGVSSMRAVWNYGVKVSRLSIDQVKLLGI